MNHSQPHASLALVFVLSAAVSACGGRFDPAHFEGSSESPRTAPEALRELATRTSELEAIGGVHASCTLRPGFRSLDGEALSDLDCTTERLDFALRESAANAGGDALIGVHCSSRRLGNPLRETHRLSCGAEVARFSAGSPHQWPLAVPVAPSQLEMPAPSAAEVRRIDEPDVSLSFRISLKFEPTVPKFDGRPRANTEVNELGLLPLADRPLGDLVASCEDGCDERALRRGLLIAAGRLGVPDVVSVRCFSSNVGNSCVGTLAAPELAE